jgi:zinc D-Ala-D-Ala carboxypeptidase
MKLTEHFSLSELLASQTATRRGFVEQFKPSDFVIDNLKMVCVEVLEPLRKEIGLPITISSGYRCFKLNKAVGGAVNSQHLIGQAVDIAVVGMNTMEIVAALKKANIEFDQCIEEFGDWVHISFNKDNNRGEYLQARRVKGKIRYSSLIV